MATQKKSKLITFISHLKNDRSASNIFARFRAWFILFGFLIVVAGGGYALYKFVLQPDKVETGTSLQTAVARLGDLSISASGTGTLIPVDSVSFGFETSGLVNQVLVSLGDHVEIGQVLASLDDTDAQSQLADARRTLRELTSPAAVALARQAVVKASQDLAEAQSARGSVTYWYDAAIEQKYQAELVLAQANLERAQTSYDNLASEPDTSTRKANAYQALFNAREAVKTAQYYVNLYSTQPSQGSVDEADANLAYAQAMFDEAGYYLSALTEGDVPDSATGSQLIKLEQARSAVVTAQENLENTILKAPISGVIMSMDLGVGDKVGTANLITINDLSAQRLDVYLDESDWTMLKVGYSSQVTFDALPDTVYTGKVIQVDPGLFTQGMTSAVHGIVQLDPPKEEFILLIGMSAAVDVISASAGNAVLVPVEALREISTGEYALFVLENGEPVMRPVTVGLKDSYYAEITSGLQAGEVVTTGIVETK